MTIARRGAGSFDFAEEVGPDFGLGDDDDGRLQRAQDAADGEDVIDGGIKDAVGDAAEFVGGGGVSGEGGAGDEEAGVRKFGAQAAQEFQRRTGLPRRKLHATRLLRGWSV